MRKLSVRQQIVLVLIMSGVAAVVSFLFTLLEAATGQQDDTTPSWLIGVSMGAVASGIYMSLAGNRKIAVADGATRAAALAPGAAGVTRLIVFRQGFVGKLQGIDVLVDGVCRTQLKSPRFAVLAVAPGEHVVETEMMGKRSAPLGVTVVAGETAAVQVRVGLGKAGPALRTDLDAVRAGLASTPMVTDVGGAI